MDRDELARLWSFFSVNDCRGYSGLYEQATLAVAESVECLDWIAGLPPHTWQPNMLLAAVHDRVLQGVEPELSRMYDTSDVEAVGEEFVRVVLRNREALADVMTVRFVQTNEVGRTAFLAPALAMIHSSDPLTLVDVGTSAGLTLTLDLCRIDYGSHGALGPQDSPVLVECSVLHGHPPIAPTGVSRRLGLDRNPLNPSSEDDRRWMLACVWPDTGRGARTRAVLDLAALANFSLVRGDAVHDLPALLESIEGPVVITTTWVVAYMPIDRRVDFGQVLAAASEHRPIYWVSAEAPGVVAELPQADAPSVAGTAASVLGMVRYVGGAMSDARVLAHVHPHGQWLWWYD